MALEQTVTGMRAPDILFQPFSVRSLTIKNRIVMAPMTRSFSPGGVPGEDVARYYERRALGEAGLILSEGTVIDRPGARNDTNVPSFYGEAALAGWSNVLVRVQAAGGRMGPQIWHVGSLTSQLADWAPDEVESPSGLMAPGVRRGTMMSDAAIADTIEAYARAAADARRLGFDTLEIHGAHGYLIDQFFWPATNIREDRFGGASIGERGRFAAEVIRGVRAAVGPDFPIFLRVSQWKQQDFAARIAESPAAMSDWLLPLVEAGVDVLHCSQRRFWEAEFPEIDGEAGLNFAGWAKKLTGAATVSVGSVGLSGEFVAAFSGETSQPAGLDGLIRRMEAGEFDLVAVGRALVGDPLWPRKIRLGEAETLRGFSPDALSTLE
jgi:2,4-dienoyl-CoA reductase-like NADH-dependent reductase (Old Yellow Enzyme family)